MQSKEWFIERIGKRIFRRNNFCNCEVCKYVHENGLLIEDIEHAMYLDMSQYDPDADLDLEYYEKEANLQTT